VPIVGGQSRGQRDSESKACGSEFEDGLVEDALLPEETILKLLAEAVELTNRFFGVAHLESVGRPADGESSRGKELALRSRSGAARALMRIGLRAPTVEGHLDRGRLDCLSRSVQGAFDDRLPLVERTTGEDLLATLPVSRTLDCPLTTFAKLTSAFSRRRSRPKKPGPSGSPQGVALPARATD
jgi:hypothetical protein